MTDPRIWNVYAGQEFLTPGAREMIDIIGRSVPLDAAARVLEVAYGTGVGACRVAERHGCRVLGVDTHPFAVHVARRASERGLGDRVAFAIGDGGRLPVRDAAFDLAICVGAPSIIGTERCHGEMHRALRPGGAVAVSDWVWARKPIPPAAIPDGYDIEPLTLDEYRAAMRGAGFEVALADPFPQSAWDEYYAPLRRTVADLRARHPEDAPQQIEDELRVYDSGLAKEYWRYVAFAGHKR